MILRNCLSGNKISPSRANSNGTTVAHPALPEALHCCAALVEALNRHRGKGQQKVTVEHVHVHAGRWLHLPGRIEVDAVGEHQTQAAGGRVDVQIDAALAHLSEVRRVRAVP